MVKCPKCGSGSVKKSSAIYEQGISKSQGRSTGVWLSKRGLGVWSGHSSSDRISGAAARNAPTGFEIEAFTFVGVFFVTLVIGFFSAGSFGTFVTVVPIAFVVAGIMTIVVGFSQKTQRTASEAQYDRQWYCYKCGHVFEVDLDQAGPNMTKNVSHIEPSKITAAEPSGDRAEYASRILRPVQRAKSETERDRKWLQIIADRATSPARSFDPCSPPVMDLGAISRLASLGFLQYDRDRDMFSLSNKGVARVAEIAP